MNTVGRSLSLLCGLKSQCEPLKKNLLMTYIVGILSNL